MGLKRQPGLGLGRPLATICKGKQFHQKQWYTFLRHSQGTHFNPQDEAKGFDDTYKTWDSDAYGNGPLQIAYQGYVPPTGIAFMNACEAANIPIVDEQNTGNSTGVKQGTATLDANLLRSSSYDSYLKQAIHRENLDVLHDAQVRLLLTDTEGDNPRATGVEFIDNPTGRIYQVHAAKEVVVSMGAFQSPQLLMVSVSLLSNNLSCPL